jgi:uracil-DNA glycosylase family 4
MLKVLLESIGGCERCGRSDKSNPLIPTSVAAPRLMIVNSEPHKDDDLVGEALRSRGGKMLRDCLREAKWADMDVWMTHAIKCGVDKPKVGEIKACRGWLRQEIAYGKPKLVLALGLTAGRSVYDKTIGFKSHGGTISYSDEFDTMIALWHPPSKLESGGAGIRVETIEFLEKIKDACKDV